MRRLTVAISLPLLLLGGFLLYALSPREIDAIAPPDRTSFSPIAVERGQRLALLGNCNTCHTSEGGRPYAGGYGVETPFGTIYGTNITPDPETGIGAWSLEAFDRSMRQGIDREGRHLYPAFPYDHFTTISDGDVGALYAFLMTREPVRQPTRENDLPLPLRFRPLLAGWKLLAFREGRFEPDADVTREVDYGRYLVEGLGHCGACHTPRNLIQGERRDAPLRGGLSAGWTAPAIAGEAAAVVPWTQDTLETYLRDGFDPEHGAGSGPMQPVGVNLARTPREDARAMAAYLMTVLEPRPALPPPAPNPAVDASTAALFAGACLSCHDGSLGGGARGMPLDTSTAVHANDPRNLANIVMMGRQPLPGTVGSYMPGFADLLVDQQIEDLIAYVRARYSGLPPFGDVSSAVRDAREATR
ncbi:cytochrome c [Aureimonas jatrophae]|uniref:Cytochrome c, mono-and diheme variants n=1 Tax=Aureimonas jatrophae TaxID=1166073 RepID=A0A1H0BUN8_9HYPH|nr:cytochrome c [Aureimonas jatrophae]MBB3948938.1 mono/diheme cytochrome c family protein [Aureimonas jatrophae]SDN49351.1 Cytochrome c, mono-and diheme variants [Aureimonas jatrophae]